MEGYEGEGGAHIHKRYEATNEWFGINRGLLLFMVLLPMQAYAYIHSHSLVQLTTFFVSPSLSPLVRAPL